MRNGLKKVMALVLTLMMILSLVPATVFAETTDSNTVVVKAPVAPQSEGDEQETYSIVINYVFENGEQAANPWTATIAKGSSYAVDVQSPTVVGYTADQTVVNVNVTDIQENKTYTVTYSPALVNFTVEHYLQNVDNDEYTLDATETKQGLTEATVGTGLAKTIEGFTSALYDTTIKIAADGSTVVEIKYDRNYYLLNLNLDGGYGADPVYARFGATINIDDPQKSGYTFGGWEPAKPDTMPAKDMTLTAKWNAGQATYLVQYWLENANDDDYSYDSSVQRSAAVGSSVSGSGDKTYTGFHFDHADQNVTVLGDGTAVVNVYYKRNTYTLKFMVDEGWLSSNWVTKAEFTNIKYGADTSQWWNQAPSGYRWKTSKNGNTAYTYAPAMPNSNLTVYGESVSTNYKYTIHYYEENTTNKVKDDNVYYRSSNGYYLTDEDYIYIPGFTCLNSGETQANGNLEYSIYYRRNSYTLDFNNHGEVVRSETILYDYALSGYNFTPDYPNGLEPNAYTFGGWYTDPGFLEPVDWDNAKMPYNNTVFYAKWNPIQHKVTYAKEEGATPEHEENVDHGSTALGYSTENGGYTFIGWFYRENGVEKAYTPSMAIRKDLELYAKWSSNVMVPFTIRYTLENGTVIATETVGSALAGTTRTFVAKTGSQLDSGYQSGYFPMVSSHSITMNINGGNEYTFVYVQRDKVNYTVRYLEKGTGTVLHEEKTAVTSDAVITEKFVTVPGYRPDAYQKRLVLSADESENVITFWYEKDEKHAPVQIIHWTQNIAGTGYTEYSSSTNLDGLIGETYTADWLNLDGFVHNEGLSNVTGKLTAEGLVLNLYYDRIEYPYEFRYLEQGTDTVLAESVTGKALYEATVSGRAKEIPGYTLVSPETQVIKIGIEESETPVKNVKTFYYTQNTINITYVAVQPTGAGNTLDNYADNNVKVITDTTVKGSTPIPNAPTYKFVGWYTDEACTIPVDPSWVDKDNKLIPQKEKIGTDEKNNDVMGYVAATYYAKFDLDVTTITVHKKVEGNFADKSANYRFVMTFIAEEGKDFSNVRLNDSATTLGTGKTLTFELGDNGNATIANVPIGAKINFEEQFATDKGYTVTINNVATDKVENYVVGVNPHFEVVNTKNTTPDTGVSLDALPYILIIACVAAIGAFVIIRRRKDRED